MRLAGRGGLFCSLLLGAGLLAAQTQTAAQTQKTPPPPKAAEHAKPKAGHASQAKADRAKAAESVAKTPAPPPEPPKPNWPADQPAVPPTITWDSRGLEIKAMNSSLDQILAEVATDTGTKVTGFSHDERVFGVYGPAPAREVLSELLHGTSYNVLMLGDQGSGTPKELILSARSAAGPQTQAQNTPQPAENDDTQEEPQQGVQMPPPMPMRGNQPQFMSPQERWQEMQRQRQMQEQQGPPPQ